MNTRPESLTLTNTPEEIDSGTHDKLALLSALTGMSLETLVRLAVRKYVSEAGARSNGR